jgi:hypothetical protein
MNGEAEPVIRREPRGKSAIGRGETVGNHGCDNPRRKIRDVGLVDYADAPEQGLVREVVVNMGDEPMAQFVNGHEGGVDDADVDAADGKDAPAGRLSRAIDGDAIVAPAAVQIGKPLLDAVTPAVDTVPGGSQGPDLDILTQEGEQIRQAARVESVDGAADDFG